MFMLVSYTSPVSLFSGVVATYDPGTTLEMQRPPGRPAGGFATRGVEWPHRPALGYFLSFVSSRRMRLFNSAALRLSPSAGVYGGFGAGRS
jgi:hypothetical protein